MKKQIMITIAILFCLSLTITAQIPEPPKSMLSPNAASLGEYGEVPVSPFTGVPQIEIPLYEYDVSGQQIQIKATYHTSGIRPEQRSGWLGVGWNLTAGGYISRIERGKPDEYAPIDNNSKEPIKLGYYYHCSDFNHSDWSTKSFFMNYIAHHKSNLYRLDTEPDEFNFSFLGYSGSFYLNSNGSWEFKSNDNLKIDGSISFDNIPIYSKSYASSTQPKIISGFTLKDANGISYQFGYSLDAIELSISFFDQNFSYWSSSSWQLTKIKYPNGDYVNLTYERGDLTNQLWNSVYLYNFDRINNNGLIASGCGSFIWTTNMAKLVKGSLISPVFLKTIETPNAKIIFNSTNSQQLEYGTKSYVTQCDEISYRSKFYYLYIGIKKGDKDLGFKDSYTQRLLSRQLDNITIINNNNETVNNIDFKFEKSSKRRLFLKNIIIQNKKRYNFEYNKIDSMPAYLSDKLDHWGYFNNKEAGITTDQNKYYNSREPNAEVMGYGIISKISYPAGGYTRFEFEPHRCGDILNTERTSLIPSDNRLIGGLRIKKIINSNIGDSSDEIVTKEYFYIKNYAENKGKGGVSSGIIGGVSKYYYERFELKSPFNNDDVQYVNVLCSSNSVFSGGANANGSHIGYSEVTEKLSDGSYTVIKYSNFDTALDDQAEFLYHGTRTEYAKFSSREQDRGLILEESRYNDLGINKYNKKYEYSMNLNTYVPAIYIQSYETCNVDAPIIEASSYKIYTYTPKRKKEKIYIYEQGQAPSTTTIDYTYNNRKMPETITKTANNGEKYQIDYKYCSDFSDLMSQIMQYLHIFGKPLQITESVKPLNSDFKQIKQSRFRYLTNFASPDSISINYNGSSDINGYKFTYNNKLKLESSSFNNNDKIIYLWGYNYQYVVAEIKNATYDEVKNVIGDMNAFSEAIIPDFEKINILRNSLSNASITSYSYKPLVGITSKTGPNGVSEYYNYDYMGRLRYIADDKGNALQIFDYNYKNK